MSDKEFKINDVSFLLHEGRLDITLPEGTDYGYYPIDEWIDVIDMLNEEDCVLPLTYDWFADICNELGYFIPNLPHIDMVQQRISDNQWYINKCMNVLQIVVKETLETLFPANEFQVGIENNVLIIRTDAFKFTGGQLSAIESISGFTFSDLRYGSGNRIYYFVWSEDV